MSFVSILTIKDFSIDLTFDCRQRTWIHREIDSQFLWLFSYQYFYSIFWFICDIFIVIYLWTQWRPELRLRILILYFWAYICCLLPLLLLRHDLWPIFALFSLDSFSDSHQIYFVNHIVIQTLHEFLIFKTYFYSNHKYMRNIWINMWKVFMKISFEKPYNKFNVKLTILSNRYRFLTFN